MSSSFATPNGRAWSSLADELRSVFNEVPEDDEQFIFSVAAGTPPRLWIDMTSFVVMGRDRRTYRFLKDTRLGRTVILETAKLEDIADTITHYVAERIIERERAMEGDWLMKRVMRDEVNRRSEARSNREATGSGGGDRHRAAAPAPRRRPAQSRLGGRRLPRRHSDRCDRAFCLRVDAGLGRLAEHSGSSAPPERVGRRFPRFRPQAASLGGSRVGDAVAR